MTDNLRKLRIAVTGASGLLGRALIPLLLARGHHVVAGFHSTALPVGAETIALDLLDPASIARFVDRANADWIVHAAAMPDVDRCEREPELARAVNAVATRHLMNAVVRTRCRVLYLSTDYVFDGADGPYDEGAAPRPINVYGRTKLEGEQTVQDAGSEHLVVRSASFLGFGLPGRPTFAETMVNTMLHAPPLLAAVDQQSNITPIVSLAKAVVEVCESGASGIRHIAGDRIISRWGFAQMLARLFAIPDAAVRRVRYLELKRSALRPLNGGLVTIHALQTPQILLANALRDWKQQLEDHP